MLCLWEKAMTRDPYESVDPFDPWSALVALDGAAVQQLLVGCMVQRYKTLEIGRRTFFVLRSICS